MRAAVKGTGDSQVPGLRNKQGICRGSKMLQAAPPFPCWSHAALRAAGLWAPTCSTAGAEHVEAQAQLQDSAPGLKFSLRAFAQLSPLETSPEGARAGDTFDVTATFRSGREQGGVLALASRAPPLGRQLCTALRFPPMWPALFLTGLDSCPLYCETAAAPFSQSHCKHRPGIAGRSQACWRGGGRREPQDISSCSGSATATSRGSRAGFALLICCCRTLLAAASSSGGLGLIHAAAFVFQLPWKSHLLSELEASGAAPSLAVRVQGLRVACLSSRWTRVPAPRREQQRQGAPDDGSHRTGAGLASRRRGSL